MSQEVFNVTVSRSGTAAVGTAFYPVFWVPTDALGGGVTITKVSYVSPRGAAIASAAQPTLVSCGTAAALAANATICAALGSAVWGAGTVRDGTISTAFVDAGYLVAVKFAQTAANADEAEYITTVQYVMGY